MRIISKVKDYYDFVGKIYGEDDTIIYNRLDLSDQEYKKVEIEAPFSKNSQVFSVPYNYYLSSIHQLIICGHVFTVYKELSYDENSYKLVDDEKLASIIDDAKRYNPYCNTLDHYYKGEYVKQAADICKAAGQPVVIFCGNDRDVKTVYLSRRIPNLGELGISAFYKPEELFQKIQQFIANVIRTNPDIAVPVAQDNNNKIVSHGFDLKTSFRHRK